MIARIAAVITAIVLGGCIQHRERTSPADRKAQIAGKIDEAKAALNALADPATGWPSKTDCDGTLWAGIACAGGHPVQIELAEYAPGLIHRRPATACWSPVYGDQGSRSTVSNDMLLGYFTCAWYRKDHGMFRRVADYGETHDWVMGEPVTEPDRVVMRPNQIGLLGRAIYALSGGTDDRYYRRTARAYFPVTADYERHLQALGIVLQGEITTLYKEDGAALTDINDHMLERLEELTDAEPLNAGFHVALGTYTGDMGPAVDLFLDDSTPIPSYVRGDNAAAFAWAERLFWLAKAHARME